MMNDSTMDALRVSLRGLASRQRALSDNIANLETPNYLAKRVDFESALNQAINDGTPASANVSQSRSMDETGLNGNNVNLDDETILSTETALRYQMSVEALNAKYRLLRTAIRGQL
jgi:flagellar basal-body rod protein FlgB